MCNSPLHPLLAALPKCEHHIHLEGSLEPPLLFSLAAKNNITLPASSDPSLATQEALLERYTRFSDLDDFLHYYYLAMSVLIHAEDFEMLAAAYFERVAKEGVRHAEVFFDPQAHLARGVSYETVLSGFEAAKGRAERELGMSVELIVCFLRHLPVTESLALVNTEVVLGSLKSGRVRGVGLDSSERDFPPALFKEVYAVAKRVGARLTAHAGEEGPAEYIRSALDDLKVSRIDHGIALARDGELMRRVAEEKVLLSVCPKSNVLLRCVEKIADLPIRQFLEAGVRFSVNSDDPAYFGGYILSNYCALQEAFGLGVEEWATICTNGIEGSWCGDDRKGVLLGELESVLARWKNGSL